MENRFIHKGIFVKRKERNGIQFALRLRVFQHLLLDSTSMIDNSKFHIVNKGTNILPKV